MLQDSRSPRANTASGTGAPNVGRTITRRMTGNGCSKRYSSLGYKFLALVILKIAGVDFFFF